MNRIRARRVLIALLILGVMGAALVAIPVTRHALVGLLPPTWKIEAEAALRGISTDHSVRISMPDGVRLAASVYLPRHAKGPLPTVLVFVPYGRRAYGEAYNAGLFFARNGYAGVVLDVRGSGDSEGELLPWRQITEDGSATLDWIASQPWSNGKVGTFGCSALGETQLVLSRGAHPAHAAMITSGSGGAVGTMQGRFSYFGVFEGGVFQLASGFGWYAQYGAKDPHAPPAKPFETRNEIRRLPLESLVRNVRTSPTGYDDFLSAPLGDPRWEQWGYLTDQDLIRMPTLLINTWGDQTVGDSLVLAEYQRRNSPAGPQQKVIIGRGVHCQNEKFGLPEKFGPTNGAEGEAYRKTYLRWFDFWLRGDGVGLDDVAPYTYYMLNEDRWYEADRWPPAGTSVRRWHLGSGGKANTRDGDGVLAPQPPSGTASDTFRYDPENPVPSRGGALCCTGDPRDVNGPVDQTDVEIRPDVLVYTSAPLEADLRIAGPLKAVLTMSSDAPDTDLVARLVDVSPDGKALNFQEGALRLRYRDGVPARLMEPGSRYTVTVDMRAIAYLIPKGHRLRLDVTSSTFPRLERNLNTGRDNYRETEIRVATNQLHHGEGIDAYVELPLLPAAP